MSRRDRERARRQRRQAEANTIIASLKAAGKNCGNCEHFKRAPFYMKGHICDLFSEFSGYQTTATDNLCSKHSEKQP